MSKQRPRARNTMSVGYKYFQISAQFKGFVFTGLKDVKSGSQSESG